MTFGDEFARTQGQPISVGGRHIIPALRRSVRPGERIRAIWRIAREMPVQGICMKVKPGKLLLGENGFSDVVLWRDTAPDETVFVCRARKTVELMVWNCWRDDRGVMQAWVGNAAMRVNEIGANTVRFECNSRFQITFEDLVFDLVFDEP